MTGGREAARRLDQQQNMLISSTLPDWDLALGSARDGSVGRRSFAPCWKQEMPICRSFTGATGLEPATSGVTGRSWRFRAERG
jgi:hypothetical protein